MKIVTITTIKNEADIIESFVRYHLNIVDLMIILNNGSTDDTNTILENLVKEGLPIVVIIDKDKYFEPKEKYNFLLNKALNEYGADIICPLDVDEFITCKNGNPRRIIEKIDPYSYYSVKWKTYVPTDEDDMEIKFIPLRITHIRDESLELMNKVMITKEIVQEFGVGLDIGNHHIDVKNEYKNKIKCNSRTELNISHFPLRSIEQTMSKVMISYPNTLSRKKLKKGMSHHYTIMFNKIINEGTIDFEDVTEFAKQYSLKQNKGKDDFDDSISISIKKDPVNLSFCENIEIKYSFNINPMKNVLENYVYFAKEINKFKNDIVDYQNDINKYTNQVHTLNDEINSLKHEIQKVNELNQKNINKIKEYDNIIPKYIEYIKIKEDDKLISINKEKIISNNLKQRYISLTNKKLSLEYSFNEQHKRDMFEINYLKQLINQHNNHRNHMAIMSNSKFKDININIKIYDSLIKHDCFDLSYYLNRYPEVLDNELCKKFSPQLHFVCQGFDQGYVFNPKFSNIKNKKDLLELLDSL